MKEILIIYIVAINMQLLELSQFKSTDILINTGFFIYSVLIKNKKERRKKKRKNEETFFFSQRVSLGELQIHNVFLREIFTCGAPSYERTEICQY